MILHIRLREVSSGLKYSSVTDEYINEVYAQSACQSRYPNSVVVSITETTAEKLQRFREAVETR